MPIRLSLDFLAESLQARKEWNDTFKVLKEKKLFNKNSLPLKLFFRNEGKINISSPTKEMKQKLRKFITNRCAV